MTREQELALSIERDITVYEHESTITDINTGEIILQSKKTVTKTSKEPEFIKVYYRTMLAFNGANDIPLQFVLALSGHIDWANEDEPMIFYNTKMIKERICKSCKIKESMYTKYISRCRENGLLIPQKGYRGAYEVNPFFIAKGKWDNIKQLRTSFDFIAGKWERVAEIQNIEEDNQN